MGVGLGGEDGGPVVGQGQGFGQSGLDLALRSRAGLASVIDVPLCLVYLLEAVSLIEGVSFAATQGTYLDWEVFSVSFDSNQGHHRTSNSLRLVFRQEVKVIKVQQIWQRTDYAKSNPHRIDLDEVAQHRVERRQKTLSGTLGIKAPNPLQAVAHGGNPDAHQYIRIR